MSKDVRLLAYKVCLTGLMAVASGIGPRATAADGAAAAPEAPNPIERMWYQRPAADWNEALPLGNGRLGAMVFGGTGRERLQLNEETIWTGEPDQEKNYRCDGPKALPEIRRLTLEGRWSEAQALFGKAMVDRWWAKYQPMCDLWLEFPGHEAAQDYRRELSLDDALATTTYTVGEVTFRREFLISPVDHVLAGFIAADSKLRGPTSRPRRIRAGFDTLPVSFVLSRGADGKRPNPHPWTNQGKHV